MNLRLSVLKFLSIFSDFQPQLFLTVFLIFLVILRTKYLTKLSIISITYFLVCEIHKNKLYLFLPAAGESFGVSNNKNAIKLSYFMQPARITGKKQAVLNFFCKSQKLQPGIVLKLFLILPPIWPKSQPGVLIKLFL